ncbi:hypothetical protein AOCH_003032 [Aspergillus ochraceoroseus]|uniref:Sodium/calcium exchanger membrane region domain-containing protein n=1 Tax=Aspergillus ochraceoroseus TaxID=138278 RepID=A0A0F8WPV3_9EURO|nr:hypothetical protein AOCH_003032 [Aspergillus ochraceoroseus]
MLTASVFSIITDRIHSWAKAHAFSGNSQPQPQAAAKPQPTRELAQASTRQNGQVNKEAGNSASPELPTDAETQKRGLIPRAKDGTIRFLRHTKNALCHSWVNVLLVFVPIGIAVEAVGLNPAVVFAMNAVAIIPLAGLLSHATESVASRLGDTVGALLNVTFGNAVELIIFIIALVKNEIRIVQASLLGSILANLLLILGMAFLLGGLRFQEQVYNSTVTQMSACLLSLSVTSLLLPTAFHASWSDSTEANRYTLKVSRGTSVVLLLVYVFYIIFQLKSHSYLYASVPQQIIDEESHPGVLAEFMNSSDSSSSSSDESDDTTTSWTTAKRIKRAMKYRRHRKSSTSSRGTSSPELFRKPSYVDVPSIAQSRKLSSTSESVPSQRDETGSPIVALGEDARDNADNDNNRPNGPHSRDFGHATSIKFEENQREKKRDRKKRRMSRKHETKESALSDPQLDPALPGPAMELAAPGGRVEGESELPRKWSSPFRPNLPSRLLSNTVFASPPPVSGTTLADPAGNFGSLRRTHSLPSMANRPSAGNPVQFARAAARIPSTVNNNAPPEQPPKHAEPEMSRTAAVVMLLLSTGLVAACAEFLVGAIPDMTASSPVSEAFIGLIILPIVGNAAEHVTAVTVATKNKMDLAIGVSVGSSIQIALFVTPLVVILGWCMDKDMSLYFTLFETISLFVTAFVVNFLILDGRSNYLEGLLLCAAYVIIAVASFYYPGDSQSSSLGAAG